MRLHATPIRQLRHVGRGVHHKRHLVAHRVRGVAWRLEAVLDRGHTGHAVGVEVRFERVVCVRRRQGDQRRTLVCRRHGAERVAQGAPAKALVRSRLSVHVGEVEGVRHLDERTGHEHVERFLAHVGDVPVGLHVWRVQGVERDMHGVRRVQNLQADLRLSHTQCTDEAHRQAKCQKLLHASKLTHLRSGLPCYFWHESCVSTPKRPE